MTYTALEATVNLTQDNSYIVEPGILYSLQGPTGLTLAAKDVVCRNTGIIEAGDAGNQLSAWALLGYNFDNTDDGYLYWKLEASGGDRTVTLYKDSGGASADGVASGTRTGDGAITLTALNSSGLTGSVTLAYSGDDTTLTANILTTPLINYAKMVATSIGATQIPAGIVEEYDSTSGIIKCWKGGVYKFSALGITTKTGYEDACVENLADYGIQTV